MALVAKTLADELFKLYGSTPVSPATPDVLIPSPASPEDAAEAWADALETYIVTLVPPILTEPASIEARKSAASAALLTVFNASPVSPGATTTLATSMSNALFTWATAVGTTFTPPTVAVVVPLAATLLAPLTATFVLNSTLQPSEDFTAEELQKQAVTNIANTVDTWLLTGTAQTSPGPPPVIVNWS